ncbi:MAG: formimidoylglutamate deiminase [Betaproteobacteria bacterium]|nr:formimidoylglutamate deiminase [Betaproteobacteria bacterium]
MKLFAESALLPEGWRDNVLITVDDGRIESVTVNVPMESAERLAGPVIPGMPNVHSHAFQRAMAGLTERAGLSGENFWAWRDLMYRFLDRITPEDNEAIAAQLYIESLKQGYTSIAEFHYLHHDIDGRPYANPAEMADRCIAAASFAGIGLTLLPVFYAHATFGGVAPQEGQRRFIHDLDSYGRALDAAMSRRGEGTLRRVGIAPHSLRAVTPEELRRLVTMLDACDNRAPIHIHVAEQRKEVNDCLAWSHKRPVTWLLENAKVDARWCLIHATHLDDDETFRLAQSEAVAGLCPSTEANLGDGIFGAPDYFLQRGCWGIGGDSHVGNGPFEELKLIEYAQRLKNERRNILNTPNCQSIGGGLYRQALAGGAQALGQPIGAIEAGKLADLVVLDTDEASLCERRDDALLDAAVFGPVRQPVRDVMVGGHWVVRQGCHAEEERVARAYREVMRRLLA